MLMAVTFLTLLPQILYSVNVYRTCVPNTQFLLNGRVCACDKTGRWTESNCYAISRRQSCVPGHVIWQGCNQCICQDTGQFLCTNTACTEEPPVATSHDKSGSLNSCSPFKTYYVNCSICVCPASGRMSESRCAVDTSCSLNQAPDLQIKNSKNICIPKVMYIFPCLHCLCSDNGHFLVDKCVETCKKADKIEKCKPRTFYRNQCNVCRCPNDGTPDNRYCTKDNCSQRTNQLKTLKIKSSTCVAHTFTKPKCFYCDCNSSSKINENSCLEQDCLTGSDFKRDASKDTCYPGEMVPICVECFCLKIGTTNEKYCTKNCSHYSKIEVLERVFQESLTETHLIERSLIKKSTNEACDANTLYNNDGNYCLCPEDGKTDSELCVSYKEATTTPKLPTTKEPIDFNASCEANTFVEFDCNTCYCNKHGKIDPKWCTYDDCDAKRIIQEAQKKSNQKPDLVVATICTPGSIIKSGCNFCICPETGLVKDKACTKNDCSDLVPVNENQFTCEPLAYYAVDCNICYCPKDGLKNVAKCTKNQCEKSFLRSDSCEPGQLYSDQCSICVCPPSADKSEGACTNRTCTDLDTPWKKIFKISQNLLGNHIVEDTTRNLDLCFPGEEFTVGCKLCICPEMGIRTYATCTPILCDNEHSTDENANMHHQDTNNLNRFDHGRHRRDNEDCLTYNLTNAPERQECTPGSMYIIRCKQCICPYMGNINNFCRPLPTGTYCEQAYPGFNYLPMGRRIEQVNSSVTNDTTIPPLSIKLKHNHTRYECNNTGRITDECFMCDCEDGNVIEEHCFQNDDAKCDDAKPTFFTNDYKVVLNVTEKIKR